MLGKDPEHHALAKSKIPEETARGHQQGLDGAAIAALLPEALQEKHEAMWAELGKIHTGYVHLFGDIDIQHRGEQWNLIRTPEGQQLNTNDVERYIASLAKAPAPKVKPAKVEKPITPPPAPVKVEEKPEPVIVEAKEASAPAPEKMAAPANTVKQVTRVKKEKPARPLTKIKTEYHAAWHEVAEICRKNEVYRLMTLTGTNTPAPWLSQDPERFAKNIEAARESAREFDVPALRTLDRIEALHEEFHAARNKTAGIDL